jgi:hypothetical protein
MIFFEVPTAAALAEAEENKDKYLSFTYLGYSYVCVILFLCLFQHRIRCCSTSATFVCCVDAKETTVMYGINDGKGHQVILTDEVYIQPEKSL